MTLHWDQPGSHRKHDANIAIISLVVCSKVCPQLMSPFALPPQNSSLLHILPSNWKHMVYCGFVTVYMWKKHHSATIINIQNLWNWNQQIQILGSLRREIRLETFERWIFENRKRLGIVMAFRSSQATKSQWQHRMTGESASICDCTSTKLLGICGEFGVLKCLIWYQAGLNRET